MVGSAAVKTAVKTVPCQLTVVTCQGWFMPTLSGRNQLRHYGSIKLHVAGAWSGVPDILRTPEYNSLTSTRYVL